ncbi:hypothetical protein ACFLYN_05490, partial [Chloroflexota bacterium]
NNHILIYIVLITISAIALFIQHLTHMEFLLHIAAIPLEVLVAVFIVERYLENRRNKERRRQLMHIKSCMFRLEMRNLFISNLNALKSPSITISQIKTATLPELNKMREDAENIEYKSLELMEPVIMEYANTEHVWRNFMDMARDYGFEDIFQDMVYILHFLSDIKILREINPDKLFIHEAVKYELLMQKVMKVLGDGIRKFLDYAIEMKEKEPELFNDLISDYELSTQIRDLYKT